MSLTEQLALAEKTQKERHELSAAVDFVSSYFTETSRELIEDLLWKHWLFGTMDIAYHKNEIVSVVRWNIAESSNVFDILDIIIKPGHNGFLLMKHLIARNWHRFPQVRYVRFSRGVKYPDRKPRTYKISRILKLKKEIF